MGQRGRAGREVARTGEGCRPNQDLVVELVRRGEALPGVCLHLPHVLSCFSAPPLTPSPPSLPTLLRRTVSKLSQSCFQEIRPGSFQNSQWSGSSPGGSDSIGQGTQEFVAFRASPEDSTGIQAEDHWAPGSPWGHSCLEKGIWE